MKPGFRSCALAAASSSALGTNRRKIIHTSTSIWARPMRSSALIALRYSVSIQARAQTRPIRQIVLTLTWTELERNNAACSSNSAKGSGRMAELRSWYPSTRPNAISQQLHRGAENAASNTVLSALTAVYAVRSTMTTLGAHVGAKLKRNVAWVHFHKLDDHCSCAHGAMRSRHGR